MKLGIILSTNKDEHVWNAFRLGITSLSAGHDVKIFLLNEGSELGTIADTEHFDISKKVAEFQTAGGILLVCGTCIKLRGEEGNAVCPISTMTDLLALIEESDNIITL